MPPFARASDLDRILRCTGSLALVTLKGPDKTERSKGLVEAGDWGTDHHTVKQTGEIPAHRLDYAPFVRKAGILLADRETLWPTGTGFHEVSFAYDVLAGTVEAAMIADKAEQDAWKQAHPETCITGTADWVGRQYDDTLHVDDLKTGHAEPNPESHQNMFYGLCAALYKGEDDVALSSTHFPRYPVKGGLTRFWAKDGFFAANAAEFKASLVKAYQVFKRERKGRYETGPYQCAYCPVKEKCPV